MAWIKAPIFLVSVLVTKTTEDLQSNLGEEDSPKILKEEFSSRTQPSILISIALVLLDK